MARNSEIINRLGLPDSVRILAMLAGYFVKPFGYKGISPAQEIAYTMFRVGRFWEAVGTFVFVQHG